MGVFIILIFRLFQRRNRIFRTGMLDCDNLQKFNQPADIPANSLNFRLAHIFSFKHASAFMKAERRLYPLEPLIKEFCDTVGLATVADCGNALAGCVACEIVGFKKCHHRPPGDGAP
jgi:hypothetical protein